MNRFRNAKGFSLVELVVVVVIIGILAAVGIVTFNNIQNTAADNAAQANIRTAVTGIEANAAETGTYADPAIAGVTFDSTPPAGATWEWCVTTTADRTNTVYGATSAAPTPTAGVSCT